MSDVATLLLQASIRICILVALTPLVLAIAGRRNPRLRDAAWKATCAAMLAIPLLLLPPLRPVVAIPSVVTEVATRDVSSAAAPWQDVHYRRPSAVTSMLPVVWLIGSGIVIAWIACGAISLRRIIKRGSPAGDRLRATSSTDVEILVSSEISAPVSVALGRPVILLPAACESWPPNHLRAAIEHELAHVRRHDSAWMNLAWLACAVFWFHPAAWLVRNRLRFAAEVISDEEAARAVGRLDYARALSAIATNSRGLRMALSMAAPSTLRRRVDSLLTRHAGVQRHRMPLVIGTIVIAALAVSIHARDISFLRTNAVARTLVAESDSPDPHVRADALFKLARWQGHEDQVLPLLLAHLGDDASIAEMPRWNFLREGWSPAMVNFHHASPGEVAALGLASFGSAAAPALESRLKNRNPVVRRNAAWAIGEMRHPRRVSANTVQRLSALLRDADPTVRSAAAWTLGDLGSRDALDALRSMHSRESDPRAAADAKESIKAIAAGVNLEYFRQSSR